MGPPGHLNPLDRASAGFLVGACGPAALFGFFLLPPDPLLSEAQSSLLRLVSAEEFLFSIHLPDSLGHTQVPIASE